MSPKITKTMRTKIQTITAFQTMRGIKINVIREDGTAAFMKWMGSSNKKSLTSENPIVLIKLVNGNNTLLYDTGMSMPVQVKLIEGVLFCKTCKSDECAHVGFIIRLNQLVTRRHDREMTIDEVIDDGIGRHR